MSRTPNVSLPPRAATKVPPKAPAGPPLPQMPTPAVPHPGFTGSPPLPMARLVKATAKAVPGQTEPSTGDGWHEGDVVPAHLADQVKAAVVEAMASAENFEPNLPLQPLRMPAAIDLKDLPAEKQQEILDSLKEQKAVEAVMGPKPVTKLRMPTPVMGAAPGVNEAIMGQDEVHIDLTPEEAPAKDDENHTTKDELSPANMSLVTMANCPHCNWDLKQLDIPEPTPEEKSWYVQGLLGGQPFRKIYSRMGGKLEIELRELSPVEIDTINAKVGKELRKDAGNTMPWFQFNDLTMRYRLALQLVRLQSPDVRSFNHQLYESLDEWQRWGGDGYKDMTKVEVLEAVDEFIFTQVIKTESLMRMAGDVLKDFLRLVSKLEVSATDENFWNQLSGDA